MSRRARGYPERCDARRHRLRSSDLSRTLKTCPQKPLRIHNIAGKRDHFCVGFANQFESVRIGSIRFESDRVDLTGLLNGGPSTLWASRILTSRVSLTAFACACARASPTVSWAVCAPVGRIICRKAVRTTPFSLVLPLSPRSGRALAYRRGAQIRTFPRALVFSAHPFHGADGGLSVRPGFVSGCTPSSP